MPFLFGGILIWLGPAGIPTVSKERSTLEGLKTVSELKLNAMEIEFVRRVGMNNEMAKEVGKLAKKLNIRLSVHCPYFVNLCSEEKEKVEASKKRILDSAERAHYMGATIVVFHPGYYQKLSPEQAFEAVKQACKDLIGRMESDGIKNVRLGLETTGKKSQFGTLDEILEINKKLKECEPVVDFGHIFARNNGIIDYKEILEKVKKFKPLHSHFSGIAFTERGERHHLTIDSNQPPFEPLAEEILKRKLDITLICESPVLEQDALVMKKTFEELGYRFE